MRKKKELTREDIINGWLQKYHGITAQELVEKEPELCKSPDWFKKYAVTQEQHDEWHTWMLEELRKYYGGSKRYIKRGSWAIYLNCAPNIIKSE